MLVDISGVWFSDKSFGPYYDIVELSVITDPSKKCLIVEESDSDTENHLKK